jgi:hypothetical protein
MGIPTGLARDRARRRAPSGSLALKQHDFKMFEGDP